MSYIDVFGGELIQSSNTSYNLINLDAENITLNWATQLYNGGNVVANWMDINATGENLVLTLPDARLTSIGKNFIVVNVGNQSFSLNANDGNLISAVKPSEAWVFCLINNSTQGGAWRKIPYGQGNTVVTSVNATAPERGFTISGQPITNSGTLAFQLANMLSALEQLGKNNGVGLIAQNQDSNLALRKITAGNNFIIKNPDGADGDIEITLKQDLVGFTSIIVGNISIKENGLTSQKGDINITSLGNIKLLAANNGNITLSSIVNLLSGNALNFYNADNSQTIGLKNIGNQTYTLLLPLTGTTLNNVILTGTATGNGVQLAFDSFSTTPATAQQMQEATIQTNPVTPANFVYSNGSCKAWGIFDGTTKNPVKLLNKYNVISVTTSGTGLFTITTSVIFEGDASPVVNAYNSPVSGTAENLGTATIEKTSGNTFNIYTRDNSGNFANFNIINFSIDGIIQ